MTYKVIVSDGNNYNIKVDQEKKIKTSFSYQLEIMPQNLDELNDVEISEVNGAQDKYVLVYNSTTQTWQAVNPDVILSSAATEPIQPGLPNDFIEEISGHDVDGGAF